MLNPSRPVVRLLVAVAVVLALVTVLRVDWAPSSGTVLNQWDEDLEPLSPGESSVTTYDKGTGGAGDTTWTKSQENGAMVMLARNSDLESILRTVRSFEDRYNHKFQHDWIFLNNEPFTEQFKKMTSDLILGTAKYGLIGPEHWGYPDWIDQEKAAQDRAQMEASGIIYGGSESYRHMCRYESGFFYRHPLVLPYRYYWRVEPSTELYCDVDYDVFEFMRTGNKTYGFTITIHEFVATIPSLWDVTQEFLEQHPEYVARDNLMGFLSDDGGKSYNLCHFWSNFEIADADFWRSKPYSDYFEMLDHKGGFFYERWGDAPVHSIAASLFLEKSQVHYFEDIGYSHPPYLHCPAAANDGQMRCHCMPEKAFDWDGYACNRQLYRGMGWSLPNGVH